MMTIIADSDTYDDCIRYSTGNEAQRMPSLNPEFKPNYRRPTVRLAHSIYPKELRYSTVDQLLIAL